MMRLPEALRAWNAPAFAAVLKREIEQQAGELPLQAGLSATSVALDDPVSVMLIGTEDDAESLRVRIGVFFAGIVAGCSCADDPTPIEPQNEYCELLVVIDKATADATATLAK